MALLFCLTSFDFLSYWILTLAESMVRYMGRGKTEERDDFKFSRRVKQTASDRTLKPMGLSPLRQRRGYSSVALRFHWCKAERV